VAILYWLGFYFEVFDEKNDFLLIFGLFLALTGNKNQAKSSFYGT
jgi:hypothetical protein